MEETADVTPLVETHAHGSGPTPKHPVVHAFHFRCDSRPGVLFNHKFPTAFTQSLAISGPHAKELPKTVLDTFHIRGDSNCSVRCETFRQITLGCHHHGFAI